MGTRRKLEETRVAKEYIWTNCYLTAFGKQLQKSNSSGKLFTTEKRRMINKPDWRRNKEEKEFCVDGRHVISLKSQFGPNGCYVINICYLLVWPLKFNLQIPWGSTLALWQQSVFPSYCSKHYNPINLDCYFAERTLLFDQKR